MNTSLKALAKVVTGSGLAIMAFAAQADTYQFTLTGVYSATWTLDSSPSPESILALDGEFVAAFPTEALTGMNAGDAWIIFTNENQTAFTDVTSGPVFAVARVSNDESWEIDYLPTTQLYTGPETAPTFKLGTFQMIDLTHGDAAATLTITNISAVPEPASIAMLLAGLGVVGASSLRRRRG